VFIKGRGDLPLAVDTKQESFVGLRCVACPLRSNAMFQGFSGSELAFMEQFKVGERHVGRGGTVIEQGSVPGQFFTVLSGLGKRVQILGDGNRQVLSFVMPGDLIGLQAINSGEISHAVMADTDMTLCTFELGRLWELLREQPARAYALVWTAAIQERLLSDTIANLGQKTARQRIAWVLVTVHDRLSGLGPAEDGTVAFPWRQNDLAEATGLSLVHTNKVLRALGGEGLIRLGGRRLALPGRAALAAEGMVDPELVAPRPLV